MLPSAFDKAQFLIKTFLTTLILVKNVIHNLDLLKASGPDCILVVVLKNCETQLSYLLDDLFNICLLQFVFPDCWKVSSEVPLLEVYHKKTTTLLVFFLWLVKSLKMWPFFISSIILGLLMNYRSCVSDRIARTFNRSDASQAAAVDTSKTFESDWIEFWINYLALAFSQE